MRLACRPSHSRPAAVGISHGFDASGAPGLAYGVYKTSNPHSNFEVRYATYDSDTGTWTSQLVDSNRGAYIGNAIDMAFDPGDGYPSISYGYDTARFAHFTGSAWSITTLGAKGQGCWDTSIAYSPADGGASVAYMGSTGKGKATVSGLFYAHQNPSTGAWSVQHVDSQGSCEVELAFDALGNPAIAYNYLATLRFARWTGTAWSIQSVENGGFRAGLAFDPSSGNPVLVHQVNLSIHVVEWTGTAWSVDSFAGPNGSELPSIGFNASGVLFVSWTWYEVDLSHKTASGWVTEVIDSNTWTNQKTILVMDPNGEPSVSYNGNNASPYPRLARVDAA